MSVNDDMEVIIGKVFERFGNMPQQRFKKYACEYRGAHPEIDNWFEAIDEFLKLHSQRLNGEISFKELTLLMNPIFREAMKDILIKILNESGNL